MIYFSCNKCGKSFRVSGDKAGRAARCTGCGHVLQVPGANDPTESHHSELEFLQPGARQIRPDLASSLEVRERSTLAGRQKANLTLLGVILLVGFAMPSIRTEEQTTRGEFKNMTILTSETAPTSLKVFYLIPGLAGIGLLILQVSVKHPARGAVIVFLALLPIMIILTDPRIVGLQSLLDSILPDRTGAAMLLGVMGVLAAPLAILIGLRSRSYQPDSPLAYCIGALGAGMWFAFLISPVLPKEYGVTFMMFPIKMAARNGVGSLSMGLVVLMTCISISAIMCLLNTLATEPTTAKRQAGTAFWVLTVGIIAFMLSLAGMIVNSFADLVNALKLTCWFGGLFLLLPAGVIDLVSGHVYLHKHNHAETKYRPPLASSHGMPARVM